MKLTTINKDYLIRAKESTTYLEPIIKLIYKETEKGKLTDHKKLLSKLKISKQNLNNSLEHLERWEILYTEKTNNKKYYLLTGIGIEVYEYLIHPRSQIL